MSKFLIAISSCIDDKTHGDHAVIHETWGKVAEEMGVPYIITIGGLREPVLDRHEVYAKVNDNWDTLPQKTLFNCKHALNYGFDFIFQGFRDTYISVPRLVKEFANIQDQQVVGNFYFHNAWEDYPCGGSGYWMRADFMQKVLQFDGSAYKSEDIMIGGAMKKHQVVGYHDSRYDHCSMRGGVSKHNSNITNHLWTNYNNYFQRMLDIHNWNQDWLRQEQRKELTGQWTEQDRAYMQRIPAIKKSLNYTE
jgi:hypothetical protein